MFHYQARSPGTVSRTLSPLEAAQSRAEPPADRKGKPARPLHPAASRCPEDQRDISAAEATVEHLKATSAASEKTEQSSDLFRRLRRSPGRRVGLQTILSWPKSGANWKRTVVEIENLLKDEKQLKASLAQYQNRLNLTPVREQQLMGLTRDYDLMKKDYEDLVNKEMQSQLATSLEKNQGGRQFRLVDPPSLPVVPTSPNRLKLNLGGLAGGAAFGLLLAFLMEMRDRSFHTESELSAEFAAPIVVSVPLILTPAEERRRSWHNTLQWIAGSALMLIVSAVEFYAYRHR